jgi:hypothetical protein
VAADGAGENGLYTSELLKQMHVPGLTATEMFMRVRAEVMKQTGSKQVPWEASSLVGSFYFAASMNTAGTQANASGNETKIDAVAVEREYWETIRSSSDAQEYKDYLQTYPNGAYASVARAKVRQLETARSAPPTTVPTPGNTSKAPDRVALAPSLTGVPIWLSYTPRRKEDAKAIAARLVQMGATVKLAGDIHKDNVPKDGHKSASYYFCPDKKAIVQLIMSIIGETDTPDFVGGNDPNDRGMCALKWDTEVHIL